MNPGPQYTSDDGSRQTWLDLLEKEYADWLYRLQNNTYVLERLKLFYMDVPKCAGTSIKTLLASVVSG